MTISVFDERTYVRLPQDIRNRINTLQGRLAAMIRHGMLGE